MREHLIIDGNAVYEIDMDCMERMEKKKEKEHPSLSSETKTNYKRKGHNMQEKK